MIAWDVSIIGILFHIMPHPEYTLKLINSSLVTTLVVRKVDNVISIRWIAQNILLTLIHRIVIYPLENIIRSSNN